MLEVEGRLHLLTLSSYQHRQQKSLHRKQERLCRIKKLSDNMMFFCDVT